MGMTVFLDRDGVLNVERTDYVKTCGEFEWLPGAIEAVALLNRRGVPVYVITNQSAVGRKIMSPDELDAIHHAMLLDLDRHGAFVNKIYVCPHGPEAGCTCRKPEPGLLLQAIKEHNVNTSEAWFIGDSETDLLAGKKAGIGTILISSFIKTVRADFRNLADYEFDSLKDAVDFLLREKM